MPAVPVPPTDGSTVFGHFRVPCLADGRPVELGRGAMGVTYRAFDTGLHREVALKVIHTDRVADRDYRRRFQREARAAAKVQHPNVASVLHLGEQDGEVFYAMEFIAGRPLSDLLAETPGAPLPPLVVVGLGVQAAAALSAAHRKEVVHRDLKPANLMLLEGDAVDHEDERTRAAGNRQLKVIDFGLARRFGAGRTLDSMITHAAGFMGTPVYASPEQCAERAELDGRSDLYSLGIILWEMLTGRPPFTGSAGEVLGKHQFHPPPFEQLAATNVPAPLRDLLGGLLEKAPGDRRPQKAGELRERLDDLLRTLPVRSVVTPGSHDAAAGFSLVDLLRARGALRPREVVRLLEGLPAGLDDGHLPPATVVPPRLSVVPADPGGEQVDAVDWAALRNCPVEDWPTFTLRPHPADNTAADVTQIGLPDDGTTVGPAVALARLVRELLGAATPGGRPVPGLNAAANTTLAHVDAFPDASTFWRAFRRAVKTDAPSELAPVPVTNASPPTAPARAPSPASIAAGPKLSARAVGFILLGAIGCGVLGGLIWPRGRSHPPVVDPSTPVTSSTLALPAASTPTPTPTPVPTPAVVVETTPAAGAVTSPTPEPSPVAVVPSPSEPPPAPTPVATPAEIAPAVALPSPVVDQSFTNGENRRMVWIPPGSFAMGSPADPAPVAPAPSRDGNRRGKTMAVVRVDNEMAHRVTLTRGFWLDRCEVTQGLYRDVTGTNPSKFPNAGPDAPVEQVSWDEAVAFCRLLTVREGAAGRLPPNTVYGLPTEAQWEYACRAGTDGPAYNVDAQNPWVVRGENNAPVLDPIAWYGGNSGVTYRGGEDSSRWRDKQFRHRRAGTHPTGTKQPNTWGLCDMLGNVWEWCADRYVPVLGPEPTMDPTGPETAGPERVVRGGGWSSFARFNRSAARESATPDSRNGHLGFRVALLPTAGSTPPAGSPTP